MSLTITADAYQTEDGKVRIVAGVENRTDSVVRIGTMMSQTTEFNVYSDSVKQYGESFGYAAAPHHLPLPTGESAVFVREYEDEQPFADQERDMHIDIEDYEIDLLTPEVTEEVTAEVTVFIRNDEFENLSDTISFIPSELSVRSHKNVNSELVSLPRTDNELQMG